LNWLQPHVPSVELTPRDKLLYGYTGIHELGLVLEGIDEFFSQGFARQGTKRRQSMCGVRHHGQDFYFL